MLLIASISVLIHRHYDVSFNSNVFAAETKSRITVRMQRSFNGQLASNNASYIQIEDTSKLKVIKDSHSILSSMIDFSNSSYRNEFKNKSAVMIFKGPETKHMTLLGNGNITKNAKVTVSQETSNTKTFIASNSNFKNFKKFKALPSNGSKVSALNNCQAKTNFSGIEINKNASDTTCNFAIAISLDDASSVDLPQVKMQVSSL